MFNTSIVTTFGGFEQRNVNWQKARGRWDVSTGLKNKTDMDTLQAFFRARFGKAYGFRFKDWTDYQAVGQVLGNGNGVITTFQLTKLYTSGSNTYSREIKKPVSGTIKIYLNGVLQGAGFTVDLTTGVVTFSSAPGAGVVVSADFVLTCRCASIRTRWPCVRMGRESMCGMQSPLWRFAYENCIIQFNGASCRGSHQHSDLLEAHAGWWRSDGVYRSHGRFND